MHVGQVQIEQDDVVIIELAEIEALFAQIGRIDVETFGRQHELDRLRSRRLILDQQNAHWEPPFSCPDSPAGNYPERYVDPH